MSKNEIQNHITAAEINLNGVRQFMEKAAELQGLAAPENHSAVAAASLMAAIATAEACFALTQQMADVHETLKAIAAALSGSPLSTNAPA